MTEQAMVVFTDLCDTLDQLQYPWVKAEDRYYLSYRPAGEKDVRYTALACPEKARLFLTAELGFTIPSRMLRSAALAVSLLNESVFFGSFELDGRNRKLCLRTTHGFVGCKLGKGLLKQMLKGMEQTVDAYREPLERLIAEEITMEQFVALLPLSRGTPVEEQKPKTARQVYRTLCQGMEQKGCRYTEDEENMAVYVRMRWLPEAPVLRIFIHAQRELVMLRVTLPFEVKAARRLDMATAVTAASYGLQAGRLHYDLREGCVSYEIAEAYTDSRLSPEYFQNMVDTATVAVQQYGDALDKRNEGTASLENALDREQLQTEPGDDLPCSALLQQVLRAAKKLGEDSENPLTAERFFAALLDAVQGKAEQPPELERCKKILNATFPSLEETQEVLMRYIAQEKDMACLDDLFMEKRLCEIREQAAFLGKKELDLPMLLSGLLNCCSKEVQRLRVDQIPVELPLPFDG